MRIPTEQLGLPYSEIQAPPVPVSAAAFQFSFLEHRDLHQTQSPAAPAVGCIWKSLRHTQIQLRRKRRGILSSRLLKFIILGHCMLFLQSFCNPKTTNMSRSSCDSHSEQALLQAFMQSAQRNTKAWSYYICKAGRKHHISMF
ncbi:hypothetical protein CHARACLAT_016854 [Characodon lateralis]|uniref:Uncharacterized protein n=1 Tax=Characodon lateralis TaxID=208331 RepID=A0ABU7DJS4_9TELE|nr:hypothetical protein [Characodon lateralis]